MSFLSEFVLRPSPDNLRPTRYACATRNALVASARSAYGARVDLAKSITLLGVTLVFLRLETWLEYSPAVRYCKVVDCTLAGGFCALSTLVRMSEAGPEPRVEHERDGADLHPSKGPEDERVIEKDRRHRDERRPLGAA